MAVNLMNVAKSVDLVGVGKGAKNVVSLVLKQNKRTGAKIARAVLDDRRTLIKTISKSGVIAEAVIKLPKIVSMEQRNAVIKDLYKQKFTQETIAAILNISQATVSKVLRKV